ncbi:MAG: serine protein kinase PrkA, partial [Myxococcota bacterium]
MSGQEQVQNEVYRLLTNFVRQGRVSKLVLLHGPNGSAKSSMIQCIQTAMEHYSYTDAGALYSFAWIFPSDKVVKSRLGFGATDDGSQKSERSFALLPAEQIDARLPCELKDHPLFLIPRHERAAVIEKLQRDGRLSEDFVVSRYLLEGDLSPRDRAIYDALLIANDGQHAEVLRHIQVERFYISRRYGMGVATIEPQMHVDADARQVTADRSIANLPRAIQSVPLFELSGPLVSANRGLVEFSDLLKRPIEAFKYLLTTSEEATASLPQFRVALDEVLVGSSNEKQLEAFREYPDWNSFKGRIELVRVPYLLRFSDEVAVYARDITPATVDKPLSPHVVEVAAMWAVLTRLKWPDPDHFSESLQPVVRRLSPLEKLRLYDSGAIPRWCTANQSRELQQSVSRLFEQYRSVPLYEGMLGASAREIRTLVLNAAHHPDYRCLTPLPVLAELEELVGQSALYEFLRLESKDRYHDAHGFIRIVREWWTNLLDEELRTSMGLVEEARYEELFSKYVVHVSHQLKKEKLFNPTTSSYEDPSRELMDEVESLILAEDEDQGDFRRAIIGRIGAWGLDNRGETPNYRELFPVYIEKMESDYFGRQRRVIARTLQVVLQQLAKDTSAVEEEESIQAQR